VAFRHGILLTDEMTFDTEVFLPGNGKEVGNQVGNIRGAERVGAGEQGIISRLREVVFDRRRDRCVENASLG
jgi:hypothetical protein